MSEQITFAEAQQLANELEKAERHYRFAVKAKELASLLANLLQSVEDSKNRVKKAQEEEADLLQKIDNGLVELDKKFEEAKKRNAEFEKLNLELKAQAEESAKIIIQNAKDQAAKERDAYKEKLESISAKVDESRQLNDVLTESIKAKRAELESVNDAVEKAKQKLREFIG